MPDLEASKPKQSNKTKNLSKADGSLADLMKEEEEAAAASSSMGTVAEHASTLPSPSEISHRARIRKKRQLAFGNLPAFVVDGYDKLAEERGLSKRALLYALLRENGVDIPPDHVMDGRLL